MIYDDERMSIEEKQLGTTVSAIEIEGETDTYDDG
jgi:hypothetical protein